MVSMKITLFTPNPKIILGFYLLFLTFHNSLLHSAAAGGAGLSASDEYGVRWKKSFRNNLDIDLDSIHIGMARIEKLITTHLEAKDATRNIAVASITVFYTQGGRVHMLNNLFPESSAFISGTKPAKTPEGFPLTILPPTREDFLVEDICDRHKALVDLSATEAFLLPASLLDEFKRRSKLITDEPAAKASYVEVRGGISTHAGLEINKKGAVAVPTNTQIEKDIEGTAELRARLETFDFEGKLAVASVIAELSNIHRQLVILKDIKARLDDIHQALKGCADAEQHAMAFMAKNPIEIEGVPGDAVINHIILHLHSRFDVCQFCAPSLWIELVRPDGFLHRLKEKYTKGATVPNITILVSCREELKGAGRRAIGRDEHEDKPLDLSHSSSLVYQKVVEVE